MQTYKLILTQEATCDIAALAVYIETRFGRERADRFQHDIEQELNKLLFTGGMFLKTQILYKSYVIYKKPFPPSIIFYILKNLEIHILRVLRDSQHWENLLENTPYYTYTDR